MKRSKDEGGTSITRRGWFGALAAVAALVVGTRRKRGEPAVDKQRRRRFWIGHT